MDKIDALAKFLGCEKDELTENCEHEFEFHGKETYLVLTDDEADEAAEHYIRESLWAFRASFIASHIGGNREALEIAITAMQEKLCESCNEAIYSMIEDFEHFVNDAISADGRGHFIAGYNFEENEEGDYYIYRTN